MEIKIQHTFTVFAEGIICLTQLRVFTKRSLSSSTNHLIITEQCFPKWGMRVTGQKMVSGGAESLSSIAGNKRVSADTRSITG